MTKTEAALRMLELQHEFAKIEDAQSLASEFRREDWAPRAAEEIARDYAEAMTAFLAS